MIHLRLSTRLILGVVLIEAVMLSVLVWNSVRLISSSHAELLENSTQEETLLIASNLAPGLLANDLAMINDSLSLLEKHRTLIHLDVYDRSGKVVASLSKKPHSHVRNETRSTLLKGVSQTSVINHDETYEDAKSDGIFDVVRKIDLYGQHLGTLHAGYSIESVLKLTQQTRLQNTTIAAIEITLSIIATILLGLFLTRGLRKLEVSAQIFGSGNLKHRIEIKGNDEISDVARSFNKMASHLSKGQAELEQQNENLIKQTNLVIEQGKQIKLLMDSTEEGIYGADLKGICTFVNPACLRMLGYESQDELVGESIHDLIHHTREDGSHYPKEECQVGLSTKIGKSGHSDKELHWRKDGSSFPIEWWSHPIIENDVITGTVVTFIDISKRIKQDEQLRRSQKMDALGKLTGGIAHDYNNMLGVILGYSEMLMDFLEEQPKLAEYVDEIHRAGERGAKLTKKLLTFSRQQSSEKVILNINTILKNSQLMLEKTMTVRISLKFDLAENLWAVNLDLNDLEDAILNISINAMHAIEGNGTVTYQTFNEVVNDIDAKHLQIEAGEYVVLSISDTGCGMDDETKEKVFDPFYSTKGEKGTGLGLSQVYGLVQRSDGNIIVYSEVDHGTQFVLYFPRYIGSVDKERKIESVTTNNLTGHERILVVDDEPSLTTLTSQILNKHGYITLIANSGKEALDILENESIDLLLSDVIMPEMDGYQLSEIVREKYPTIKIQLASGFSDDRHIDSTYPSLHENLLHKPFLAKTLLKRVRELLDN